MRILEYKQKEKIKNYIVVTIYPKKYIIVLFFVGFR